MVFENEINLYGDAPIANKFSTQDTKFDVVQGHINAIVSESEMIELIDSGKTMYSGMNDIKVDVTGIHGNISSLTTRIDGQSQQITQINSKQAQYEATLDEFSASLSDTQSDLETTSQNLATLQLDTSQFKTTVSNTYSTKTQAQGYASSAQSAAISAAADDATSKANAAEANANAATDNKLRNYSTTSSVSSMIDQKADEITMSVSRSYATKEEAQTAARTTITGDTIYYLAYANNTGVTTSTSGWTPDPTASSAQISESKKYLWTYHRYTYGDGHTSNTTPVVTGTYGTKGQQGTSVTVLKTEYQSGTSPTSAPTGTWSTSVPSVAEGNYLWTRVTYTDGNISYSVAKQGKTGNPGTSVTVSKTEYQSGTSATSTPTGTWSTSVPSVAEGNYLWTRVTYSDGKIAYSVAKQGKSGTSVTVSKTEYQSGSSATSAPTGTWSTSIPSVSEGNYLWTKVTYSDGKVAYSVAKQGKSGTSVTVSKTEYAYQLSTSGTTPPTGTWSTTPVAPTETQYAWTRTTTTFSDNSKAITYTVGGKNGASATTYSLIVSRSAVVRKESGTYDPSSITIEAKAQVGSSAPSDYSGRFRVQTSSDGSAWSTRYTSSANESSYTYSLPASTIAVIRVLLYLAGGTTTLVDQQTIPIVTDGTNGTNGKDGERGLPGEDAYTVVLTNENHTFPGSVSAAIASETECNVLAFKGATQIAATIGTISGAPTGMSTSVFSNSSTNARFKVSVTTSMTTKNGVLTIPVTVDGKVFNMKFTYSLALKGDTGVGISQVTPLYYAKNNNTAPSKPAAKITTTTTNTGVWTKGIPALTNTYKYLFTCDQVEYDDGTTIEWTTVVEDKSASDVYTRLTTAESKVTDSAIINTVTQSGQFPTKGEIILAINETDQSVAKINANKLELSAYSTIEQTAQKLAEKNGSYIGDGAPTSSNYPASSWTSDAVKQSHIGDIYYDKADGFAYQYTGDSSGLLVKFNSNSRTEAVRYDYVRFYYKKGDITYALDDIGGTIGAKEVFIPAKEFWVYWRTDSSAHDYYGFALDSVSVVRREIPQAATGTIPSYAVTDTSTITSIASPHNPYEDNTNKIWHFTYSGSISITESYAWVRRKDNDIAQAEANITALGEQITSKVSKGDIASTINQTAQSVLIDAQKINLQGYLTISSAGNTYATKSDASSREQYVYYQSSSSSVPSTSSLSTWITSNSDTYNQWVTRRPTYRSSYSHIFICRQMQSVDGTVTFTSPVSDQTTTVIDGGSITTGIISADRVMGGTFKAGGSSGGTSGKNGAIEIYNSYNQRIGRFDSTGLYMGNIQPNLQLPNFSIDTTGKVGIRLASSVANTVEMSTSGMLFAYPENYYVAFGSGSRYYASTSQGAHAILAARDTAYSYYKVALYKNKIEFNTSNTMDAPNSFSALGIVLNNSVHIGMTEDSTNAPGYGALFNWGIYNAGGMFVAKNLKVNGTKNRVVQTSDYSKRLFYSYETASPMFGDVGEGIIGEDGKCYIQIDPIYAESVTLNQYQVFLQKYGEGECYVLERNPSYFVVSGTAGIKFGWEIKAKQSDFDQYRLERDEVYVSTNNSMNYIDESLSHIALINEERKPQND